MNFKVFKMDVWCFPISYRWFFAYAYDAMAVDVAYILYEISFSLSINFGHRLS